MAFRIGKTPVSISLDRPIIIEEDDMVVVAGGMNNGVFQARAYRNNTRDVWDAGSGWSLVLLAIPLIPLFG
ncbi:hypothetical protein C5F48_14400 [Cereibacter changlensis JA139]|uniref:Uncharacterized protein n=1 Tax=Cereibacter changlensis JA139 TaxID=1188249 RepID=A0A2T4JT26_9RHOB|nr:hypothetical protein C5F48_14400 [Cereibacter changlensis JA139]